MKPKILILFFLCSAILSFGQESKDSTKVVESGKKNVIKFLPVNLAFNSLSFELERKVSPRNSLILGVGISQPKGFAGMINLETNDVSITNESFGTMALRLAYRHYTGHKIQPAGFYISPYLKYQNFNLKADNKRTKNNTVYNDNFDVSANTLNLGFQMGYQFLIAKTVSIDLFFLGFEAGMLNVTATVKSNDPELPSVKADVDDQVSKLPSFLADKIKVTSGTNQIEVKGTSIPYPWLRSGISIGIAF